MKSVNYSNSIPCTDDFDIAVCGGGVAGFCAAIAAARMGAKTCIIEKNRMLGGVMTSGGNNDIALFCAGDRPVIRGIGWEFVRRLDKIGYADIPVFRDGVSHSLQGVKVNIPMAACLMDTMCLEENVALSFGATIVDVRRDGGLWLLICAKKGALSAVRAKFVIDCTGDGDAAFCAGAEYELGDPHTWTLQPGTLRFFPSRYDAGAITREQMRESFVRQVAEGTLRKSDFWPGANGDPREIMTHHGDNINHVEIHADYEQKTEIIEIEARRSLARITGWLRSQFAETAEYYSTAFHEMVLSTGHSNRLNRLTQTAHFGNAEYSKEELVAEIGASALVNHAGLETEKSFRNNTAYVQSWLNVLKNDKRFIVSASGKVEKAVELILAGA